MFLQAALGCFLFMERLYSKKDTRLIIKCKEKFRQDVFLPRKKFFFGKTVLALAGPCMELVG